MDHLVRFTSPEGREGHHYAAGLDEALKFVERLRNAEDASDVRVYRLQEIPIEFRAYYKVELRAGDSDAVHAAPPPAPAAPGLAPAPEYAQPVPVESLASVAPVAHPDAQDHATRRLFTRG